MRRPPNQPSAAMTTITATTHKEGGVETFVESTDTQPEDTSGASPSAIAGSASRSNHEVTNLGMLISLRRLPAIASKDRRLVLDASSSTSPRRGSMRSIICGYASLAVPGGMPRGTAQDLPGVPELPGASSLGF